MAWSGGLTNNTKIALAKDEDKKKKIEEAAKSQSISKAPSSQTWDKSVTKRTDNVASTGKGYNKTESTAKKRVPTISAVKKPVTGGYNNNGGAAGRKVFTPSSILAKKTTAQKSGDLFGAQRRTFVPNALLSKRHTGFTKQEIENTKANQWHGSHGVMPAPAKITSGENATVEKKHGFGKWLTNNLMNGIGQFNRGVINTADFILPTAKDFGGYSAADAFFDYMRGTEDELAKRAARTNAVKGGKWQKAGELVTAVTTALPNTVLAMLSGGTSTGASAIESGMTGGLGQSIVTSASQLAKNPMFWNSFLQTAGNTYDEAKQDGANDIQATATAWISSLINAGVEVGGGIETIPNQTRSISNWVKGMFDEGKEEVIQGIVEQATKKAIYDHDKKVISKSDENAVINPQRSADEFAGGAVVGGILGAGQMGAGAAIDAYTDTVNTGRVMKDAGAAQDVIDTGAHSDKQTSAHKYAEKMQNKQEAGKGLSDWNVGRQFQKNVKAIADETDYINNFANATGARAEIHSDIDGENGRFTSGKTGQRIDISANGDTSIPQTAKHEFTHLFEQNAPEAYKFFKGYILQAATETNQKAVNSRKQRLKNEYESRNLPYTEELLNDEIAAELTEMFSISPANIEKIANGNESLADKILDGIRAAKAKVQSALSSPYANHNGIELTYEQLNKAEKLWNNALYEAAQNKSQTDGAETTKFSPIEKNAKGKYVQADRQVISGENPNEWEGQIYNYINNKIRNGQDVVIPTDDGDNLTISEKTAWKMGYRNYIDSQGRYLNDNEYRTKINAAAHIDELAEISQRGKKNIPDTKNHDFAQGGFNYRTAYFRDLDGQYYRLTISVGLDGNNKTVYNIGKITKAAFPSYGSSKATDNNVGLAKSSLDGVPFPDITAQRQRSNAPSVKRNSSTDSISDNGENVKYSFAGESSKTADLVSLENARNMEQEGVDTEDTWQSTGWSKGIEGKWKYEIDDSKARFKNGGFGLRPKTLDAGLEHAELFKAYPDLKNVVVQEDYDIGAKAKYSWFWDYILLNADMSQEEKMKSLLHEVQHAIQKREGFARGTNLEDGLENHGKTAGEIEANDVKERLEMTAEERRNVFPESMRPNDDVIFAEDNASYSKSVNADKNTKERFSLKENTGNTQITSDNFKRWFGDWENDPKNASKVINEDGTPKVVYHQTDDDFTIFSSENERAGKTDSDLPTGSFFKSSNSDIGLRGKKQMPVYLDMKKPLRFENREVAKSYWRENIPGYAVAADRIQQIDSEYQTRYGDKPIQSILDEWRTKSDEVRLTAKDFINRYIAGSNFDGIILDKDSGSFGRETDTYIVFRPEQIKSATDNIGTFDTNNADIRYSLKESTDQTEFNSKNLAGQLINEYGAKIKRNEVAADIDEIHKVLVSDMNEGAPSEAASNTAWKLSERLADKIADSISIADNDMYDTYADLRRYLRTTPIKYYDDYKSETGQFENYNELRKKSFGFLRLSNSGVGIDSVYKELSGMYPNFFNEETESTPAAQLEQILNVLEATSKKENTLSEADYNKAVDEIASRVFSEAVNHAVSERTETTDNVHSGATERTDYAENVGEMTTTVRSAVRPYGVGDIDYNTLASDSDTLSRVNELMQENGVNSPSELTEDTVSRERSKKDRNVFRGKETVQDVMSRAYTAVIDDMHPFWNYNKAYEKVTGNVNYGRDNPYKLAINSKDASSRAAYIVTDKMVDYNNNVVGEGLIGTITQNGITKENYKDFNNYLVARHAFEWLDPDNHGAYKRVYEELELNDMGVVASMITDFEQKNPEFKQAADKVYEWQRQLMKTWLVDTGVITLEQYNKFTEMYPSYVPFFREDDISVGGGKDGFANQNSPIKEAIGSQRRILEPIENIMYNVASYVNHATKHGVTQSAVRLYDMLENDSENNVLRQFWEEVEPTDIDEKKPQHFKLKGNEEADIQDATDEGQGSIHQTLQDQMNIQDRNVVTIIDDGNKRYFRVYDKDFLTLLDNAKAGKFDGVLGVLASFSRVRAALITSWNPAFSLASNPIRDFGTLMLNSTDKNKAKIAGEAVKAYADIFKNSDAYQSYLSMGGQYSSVTTEGMDALKIAMRKLQSKDTNLAKRFFGQFPKLFGYYQTVSDAIEASPRMAEFKTTLDKGYDYHEAFYRAKDVTTNFSRGGRISKTLNAMSNFLNASVQGVDKYFRQAKNNPTSFATGIACLTAAELLAWAWNTVGGDDDKDEAYENLSNYTKNNFYNFYIGKGKFVSIPKARESAVLSTTISAALDEFVDKQEDRFKDYFSEYVLSQFMPDGSIVGVSTYIDLSSNKDYMSRPIVPSNLESLPNELQYDDSTSYLAKWLGGVLKQSPKRIDHIINSDTGVFGKINKTYFTPSGRQDKATMLTFGVNSTYRKDSLFSTDQVNMFYDNKDKADKQANGYPSADNGYLSSRFAQASKVLSVLNEMYKEDSKSETGREIRRAYVNYAKDSKDNPSGLTDEVYKHVKDLYDTDKDVLSLPVVSREIKAKINKEDRSFTFSDAQSLLNYQKDLNRSVDEAYRKLLSDVEYSAMTNSEKADALGKAKTEAVKNVKQFYIENNGTGRMFGEEKRGDIAYPDEKAVTQYTEKLKHQGEINSKLQNISDAVAAAVPDKAKDYSLKSLQINDIRNISLDGKSYSVSGELGGKIFEAANEEYYSNIERLMSNEINIEDVVGYTSKGKARTSEQADGTKVSLTGKLYNSDGTPRFDELVMAKIIYKAKENAKNKAAEKYRSEIIGAGQESASEKVIPETKTINTLTGRSGSSGKSSGRKSSRSGVSSSGVHFYATEPETQTKSGGYSSYSGYDGNYVTYNNVKYELSDSQRKAYQAGVNEKTAQYREQIMSSGRAASTSTRRLYYGSMSREGQDAFMSFYDTKISEAKTDGERARWESVRDRFINGQIAAETTVSGNYAELPEAAINEIAMAAAAEKTEKEMEGEIKNNAKPRFTAGTA